MENQLEAYLENVAPWLLNEYYDHALWVWLALPALLLLAYFVSTLIVRTGGLAASWAIRRKHPSFYARYIAPMLMPLGLWATSVMFALLTHLLPLTPAFTTGLNRLVGAVATFAVIWGLFRLISNAGNAVRVRFISHGKIAAAAIMPLMQKIAKALLIVVAFLFILQNWGFDVAALLAGLGIGGIAIALAGQKTVENLFGGVSVTLDQPVRVGDFINYGDNVGTVEDIGLRSVTIRTLQRTRVTIPNAQFSEMKLENFAARDKLLLQNTFGIRYDTTPDQMRSLLATLNGHFAEHPQIETGRARFVGFGDSSLNIELFIYIKTNVWDEFLLIQEGLLLDIMRMVNEAGTDFAFPSTSFYLEPTKALEELSASTKSMRKAS